MLHRYEKFAVYNLSIVLLAVMLYFLFWQILGVKHAQGAFGMIGLTGLGHLIYLRKKTPSEIVEDERDRKIKLKASSGGYMVALLFFMLGSLAVYFLNRDAGVVPVAYFPTFVWTGWAVYILTSSVITIVQYRRGINGGYC